MGRNNKKNGWRKANHSKKQNSNTPYDKKLEKDFNNNILDNKDISNIKPVIEKKEKDIIKNKDIIINNIKSDIKSSSTENISIEKTQKISSSESMKDYFRKNLDRYLPVGRKREDDFNVSQQNDNQRKRTQPVRKLDLHGQTIYEAKISVNDFVERCYYSQKSPIEIVTGRGTHSATGEGVLRSEINNFLNSNEMKKYILSFKFSRALKGSGHARNTGAFLVRLKNLND